MSLLFGQRINKSYIKIMKVLKLLLLQSIVCLFIISCKDHQTESRKIELSGTIKQQGITTYQYGTHTINGFALKSSSVDLDKYLNKKVTVIGQKIEGYPIDGGPDYIEVEKIK